MDFGSDNIVVVCIRVADAGGVVRDSTKDQCASCEAPIWVSPSTRRALVLQPDMLLLCIKCAMAKAENEDEVCTFPGVEKELIDYYGKKEKP